ncbi:SDR family oxidoreductase [Massilia sp. 9I]|uniref:SDR family oxidoreductase n=1 Tax=Massilia sp. 9I TaxID=2653152 RepID=UPI0012F2D04F|nr:SDR family oxidoreductase [Massilia sp. 9I]VXB98073.1 Short-chain dehydrogenase [Massilia sp. 9I]
MAAAHKTGVYRAVLTGASGGIGAAIAKRLAPQCALLILVGRQRTALEALAESLRACDVQIVCGDLCEQHTLSAIAATVRAAGGIDLLVNNAGVSSFHAFETQDPADIRTQIETNLLAPMLLTRELLPLLGTAPAAQVVNIGSVFGSLGFPGFAAYGAAKAGLAGFSQALRRECADSTVAVRHFSPRATRTAINSAAVNAMNRELRTAEDTPDAVADAFMAFLSGTSATHTLGTAERFFVLVNKLVPGIPDKAIRKQLLQIRKYLPR